MWQDDLEESASLPHGSLTNLISRLHEHEIETIFVFVEVILI